jgi:hypothetical protein
MALISLCVAALASLAHGAENASTAGVRTLSIAWPNNSMALKVNRLSLHAEVFFFFSSRVHRSQLTTACGSGRRRSFMVRASSTLRVCLSVRQRRALGFGSRSGAARGPDASSARKVEHCRMQGAQVTRRSYGGRVAADSTRLCRHTKVGVRQSAETRCCSYPGAAGDSIVSIGRGRGGGQFSCRCCEKQGASPESGSAQSRLTVGRRGGVMIAVMGAQARDSRIGSACALDKHVSRYESIACPMP